MIISYPVRTDAMIIVIRGMLGSLGNEHSPAGQRIIT